MLNGLSKISKTKINVSITGIAGPSGGSKNKPVGLVYIGLKFNNKFTINRYLFSPKKREVIRKKSVSKVFDLINNYLNK